MKKALKEAIAKLDPENEDHWTTHGTPLVSAVNGFIEGDQKFTRDDFPATLTRESLRAERAAAAGEGAGEDVNKANEKDVQDATNPPEGETDTKPADEKLADPEADKDGSFIDKPAAGEGETDASGQPMTARKADLKAAKGTPAAVIKDERKGQATSPLEQARKVGSNRETFDHEAHNAKIKAGEDEVNALIKQRHELDQKIAAKNAELDTAYTLREKFQSLPAATLAIQDYHKSVYGSKKKA